MELVIHESAEAVADGAAGRIAELMAAVGPRLTLGLAGGSTPAATYGRLLEAKADWSLVDAWLSDERWVAPDHERSNGLMAYTILMQHVGGVFHRPPWGGSLTPSDSAALYEETLREIHGDAPPDLVLLGLGDDGHTASLFPGTTALAEDRRWFVANEVPGQPEPRLTATYPLLWGARRLIVLVVGSHKARALKESLEGATPAGRLSRGDAEVEWHVDLAAASLVS